MTREKYFIAINIALTAIIAVTIYSSFKSKSVTPSVTDSNITAQPQNNHSTHWPQSPHSTATTDAAAPKAKIETAALRQSQNCPQTCQLRIMDHLQTGQLLSASDIKLIIQNADIFAAQLAQEPVLLTDLLSTLNDEDDDNIEVQPAALAVRQALSDIDRQTVSALLLSSQDPSARLIGLDIIDQNGPSATLDTAAQLKRFIAAESDPKVLVKTIQLIENQGKAGDNIQSVAAALDTIIQSEHSDFISGTALMAKIKLLPFEQQTQRDVNRALTSPSAKMQRYGLEALTVVRGSEDDKEDPVSLDHSAVFENALNDIAEDPAIDYDTQLLALKLLHEN